MAPNLVSTVPTGVLYDDETKVSDRKTKPIEAVRGKAEITDKKPPMQIVWRNAILFAYLHVAAIYGLYLAITSAKFYTDIFGKFVNIMLYLPCLFSFRLILLISFTFLTAYALYILGGLGITAGAHRLWSHKSYKAKLPLRVFLMFCNTLAFQVTNNGHWLETLSRFWLEVRH